MGSAQSSGASQAGLFLVAVGLAYVMWRQHRMLEEMHELRAAADAAITLAEFKEQIVPAMDELEQETLNLRQELEARLAPAAGAQADEQGARCAADVDDATAAPLDVQRPNAGDALYGGDAFAFAGVTGVPVARVLLQSFQDQLLKPSSAHIEECGSDVSKASDVDQDCLPELSE